MDPSLKVTLGKGKSFNHQQKNNGEAKTFFVVYYCGKLTITELMLYNGDNV